MVTTTEEGAFTTSTASEFADTAQNSFEGKLS